MAAFSPRANRSIGAFIKVRANSNSATAWPNIAKVIGSFGPSLGKRRTKLPAIRLVRIQASRQDIADRLITEFVKSSIRSPHSHRRRKRNTRATNRRHIKLAEIDDGFTGQHLLISTHEDLDSRSDRKIELCGDSGIARFLNQSSSANGLRLKTGAGDGTVTDTRETRSLRQFSRRNCACA